MFEVYIEHADGYPWTTSAETLEEAQQVIENEAIAVSENCAAEEIDNVFPLYWTIKNTFKEIVASGHVNESGEIYS